jgi:hypothetical protein
VTVVVGFEGVPELCICEREIEEEETKGFAASRLIETKKIKPEIKDRCMAARLVRFQEHTWGF